MRSLYINPRRSKLRWTNATPVVVNRLVAELIDYLGGGVARGTHRAHAEALLEDLLTPVPMATIDVRFPVRAPARTVALELLREPAERSSLAQWGRRVGAGERTLARSFLAETGLPFGRWRILMRLQAALSMLAAGDKVSAAAARVGYDTASAFVATFRRETGVTPAEYFHASAPPSTDR
jgi:AraC-like DNA-binding protein